MTTPSVPPSLASEYAPDNGWLAIDTTAVSQTGKGPVTTGPVEAISDPRNATAPVQLNPRELPGPGDEFAVQAPDYLREPVNPLAGPWTPLPEKWDGKEAFGTLPDDGITPIGFYKVPPAIPGLVQARQVHAGHDAHSQLTDTAGWDQYTVAERTRVRQLWWDDYLGVDYYWPVTQPNFAQTRVARGGNQMVNGVVATYGGIQNSGGDTAYEPAPPPPVSTQPPVPAGTGTIPQWGF